VPRNFPGRSGTKEDSVFLCSPETATASALAGRITDPRDLGMPCPAIAPPAQQIMSTEMLLAPLPPEEARRVKLTKGPNIEALPEIEPLADHLELPVLLKVGDDVSTDEISPAGGRALPFRSNIPKISEFAFDVIDDSYPRRAKELREQGGHLVVGGENYGQGSSREHAALAPRWLGLRAVIARSFARIHWQNLVNFGVLPLTFADAADYDRIGPGDVLEIAGVYEALAGGPELSARIAGEDRTIALHHDLSPRQLDLLRAGGIINWMRARQAEGQPQGAD